MVYPKGEKNVVVDFLSRKQLREAIRSSTKRSLILYPEDGDPQRWTFFASKDNTKTLFLLKQVGRCTSSGCSKTELAFNKMLCLPATGPAAGSAEKIPDIEHLCFW